MHFCRLQQGFWHSLSRNLTPKTGQFQLPTIRYYLALTVPHWSNSVRWSLNINPNYPFHKTRLWHWSICILGYHISHPDIYYSKYADDFTAVIPAAISDLAGSEFGHTQDWSSANRLSINLSKTKEMVIFCPGSRAKHIPPREITGIERVHTAEVLRICFSDNLSFGTHINNTLSAISTFLLA